MLTTVGFLPARNIHTSNRISHILHLHWPLRRLYLCLSFWNGIISNDGLSVRAHTEESWIISLAANGRDFTPATRTRDVWYSRGGVTNGNKNHIKRTIESSNRFRFYSERPAIFFIFTVWCIQRAARSFYTVFRIFRKRVKQFIARTII